MDTLGDTLGKLMRDKEDMKQSLSPHGDIFVYTLDALEVYDFTNVNVVITEIDWSASNSFILGHATNGILGVANGLGGGQIVLGDDGLSVTTELVRRRWEWRTESDLSNGTYDENISIDGGVIQLK